METDNNSIALTTQGAALTPFSDAPRIAPDLSTPTKSTGGEKLFNATAYWGMGWIANASFSVWLTDKIAQGGAYHFFDRGAEWAKNKFPFVSRKLSEESIASGKNHLRDFQRGILNAYEKEYGIVDRTVIDETLSGEVETKLFKTKSQNVVDLDELITKTNTGRASLNLPSKEKYLNPEISERQIFREIKQSIKKYSEHHTVSHGKISRLITEHSPLIDSKEKLLDALGPVEDYFKDGTAKGKARSMGALLTLMSGGFVLMAPIKFMEDHKEDIVTKFDDMLSPESKRTAAEAANIEARHKEIAEEPKQTWASQIAGRSIALVPILSTHFTLGNQANVVSKWGKEFKGIDYHSGEAAKTAAEFLRGGQGTAKKVIDKIDGYHDKKIAAIKNKYETMSQDPTLSKGWRGAAQRSLKHFEHVHEGGKAKTENMINFANIDNGYSLAAASMTYAATRATNRYFNESRVPDCSACEDEHKNHAPATPQETPDTVLHAAKENNVDTSIIAEGKVTDAEHSTARA